ncbi:MAG: hypothetical protein ACRDFB_01460, partial [Rhabdochlamydiaceae bacterium]
ADEDYEFIISDKDYIYLLPKSNEQLVIQITPELRQLLNCGSVWLDGDYAGPILYLFGYAGKCGKLLENLQPTTIEKRSPSGGSHGSS